MIGRLIVGAGLFAFGYYLGKQVGIMEPFHEELAEARKQRERAEREAAEAEDNYKPGEPT